MTAEDDLKDVLLPGEQVLWSGHPDWDKAEHPKTGWRAKAGTIKFSAAMLVALVVMMVFGMIFDPKGFVGVMLGVLIALSAVSFIIALVALFNTDSPAQVRHDHVYAITDKRIIIHDRSKLTTHSIMGATLFAVVTTPNGSTKNINLSYGYHEEDVATLHSLSDPATPEKLLIEYFSRRKAEK